MKPKNQKRRSASQTIVEHSMPKTERLREGA
jgi:hypothetical protein